MKRTVLLLPRLKNLAGLGVLLTASLAIRLLTAWLLRQPGYTDAYYYAVGARQLLQRQGFDEPFIWNYLDPPDRIPHAGYQYWMPLAAMLGWLGMAALGESFQALQVPFVLISVLLPLIAYGVALELTGKQRHALLAGWLAVLPGFYTHVLVLPDTFTPFALAGSLCLWATGRGLRAGAVLWFGTAGIAAGLGHLARADGILLVGVVLLAAVAQRPWIDSQRKGWQHRAVSLTVAAAGYLVVMGPWFARNWQAFGTPLPGSGVPTLFLRTYDDMFAYNRPLTWSTYLDQGWGSILKSKAEALWLNLQRLWVEALLIFLLPFTALGLWRLRRDRLIWPFLLYLPLLFLVMTVLFTFPGMRGGLFHSGGALLPFLFAAAGPGLEDTVRWAARQFRGWQAQGTWSVFAVGFVALAALVTLLALARAGALSGEWDQRDRGYAEIGGWLAEHGATDAVVMVGDAPGFTWHTGHPAIAVPNEPLDVILTVADRYGARYLVLDAKRPRTTDALYEGQTSHFRLVLRYTATGGDQRWQLYEIMEP